MKSIIQILKCLNLSIKKKFFNLRKTDITHNCDEVPILRDLLEESHENEEEYIENYNTTTRWQTL